MTICNFFLQGRCRFGDKCWNEHPVDGGSYSNQNRQQDPAGGHRSTWSASQRYIQPSSFSQSTTWTNRDEKPSFRSFSSFGTKNDGRKNNSTATTFVTSQNRFSALSSHDTTKHTKSEEEYVEEIMADLLIWETSGQWLFSVLRNPKINKNLSGFEDISQEELRFEYYVCQAEGILPKYGNTVQLLLSKWKQRALEIKNLTPSAKATLLNELNSSPDSLNSGFGGQNSSAFGSSGFPTGNTAPTAATFSFKPEAALAQKTGETSNKLTFPGFGSKPLNTAGFGTSSTAPTAASFSFAPSNTGSQPPAPAKVAGFGSSTSTATGPAFGGTLSSTVPSVFGGGSFAAVCTVNEPSAVSDLFSAKAQAPQPATSLFKQPTGPSGPAPTSTSVSAIPLVPPSSASGSKCSPLFTQRNELSAEELAQFEAKRFVLGQIPLKPPPADLLVS